MSGEPVQLEKDAVTAALKARAVQTYSEMLDEVARLTAYAHLLEGRLSERAAEPVVSGDAWGGNDEAEGVS